MNLEVVIVKVVALAVIGFLSLVIYSDQTLGGFQPTVRGTTDQPIRFPPNANNFMSAVVLFSSQSALALAMLRHQRTEGGKSKDHPP